MADAKPKPAGKENVLTRKIGPLPTWVWVAVAAAVILLYVVLHNKSSSTGTSSSGKDGTTKLGGFGYALVPPVIRHGGGGRRRRRRDRDRGEKGEGPEREWLENKTGSERPWSYLSRHHEMISVGPHGSRVTRDGKPVKGRHGHPDKDQDGNGDEDKAPKRRAARAVPGTGTGPVAGQLMSFTTPASGPTPSLSQVAAQYNTAPDAIVEEATGRGSPHGAMWRRYVAANDWEAPLPHGTDMTVLAQPQ